MYAERPSRLPGAVLWTSRPSEQTVVVPDGCMDVLWYSGRLLVAGPDTTPKVDDAPSGDSGPIVGLRLAPGMGPSVLGTPADVLRDQRVWLDDLWGRAKARRWDRAFRESGERGSVLEELAAAVLEEHPVPRELVRVAHGAAEGLRVDELAREVGWSERTLRRHCTTGFGYGPKVLARILRVQRAAATIRNGTSLADAAARCGYADQSHLSREVAALTGKPAKTLIPARRTG